MVYFVIIWNTIVMYIASDHMHLLVSHITEQPQSQVFVIFGAEHLLLGCVFLLKSLVVDCPTELD